MSDDKNFQILLMEDDFEYAERIREFLDKQSSHTFNCKRVASFADATREMGLCPFDAVIMDIGIKGLESMEQISALTQLAPFAPILGLIDVSQEELANKAAEFGLQDTILKNTNEESFLPSKIMFAIKRMQANNRTNPLANKAAQFSILEDLLFDSKTGLPRKALFEDRLRQSLIRADRDGHSAALLAIRLDKYTNVKDTMGDRTADGVIIQAVKILNDIARDCDSISHIEQDKFMLVLEKIQNPSETIALAEKIIRAFSRTFEVDDDKVNMPVSMGISIYPDCNGIVELMDSVDVAMKRAHEAGGNRFKLYTENLREEGIWKYGLENDLQKALDLNQFELHYQTLFDLRKEMVIGLEALLRWNHPDQGLLLPGAFIDHLESSEMMLEVGEWVIRKACQDLKGWHTRYPEMVMGINLSPNQLLDPYLQERITRILAENDLHPEFLEFEITERQLLDTSDPICQYNIKKMLELGVHLALDDFGTGYSTEAYFRDFPKNTIATLKLDRTDIQGMMIDTDAADRVRKFIDYSHNNNIRIVAEGVEDEQQVLTLIEYGADAIQGFLLGKAIPGTDLEDRLRRGEFSLFENLQADEVRLSED